MEDINHYDISELPNSSFNLLVASRRSGKTVLVEQIIRDLKKLKFTDVFEVNVTAVANTNINETSIFHFFK